MAGSRSPITLLVLASLRTAYVSPSVSRSASPPLLCVATPTTCQQPCSLTRSHGGREYNMTDGHSRTNTVGHRAVRGRRMPPVVACSALRARLTCVCVARSRGVLGGTQGDREKSPSDSDTRGSIPVCEALTRRVSTCLYARRLAGLVWRYPPLLFSLLPLLSLRPPPPSPAPHTQHNTSRTGGGKRDTCLALLSKRPIRTVGADQRASPVGRRVEPSAERATLRRVQTWPLRSVASPTAIRNSFAISTPPTNTRRSIFLTEIHKDLLDDRPLLGD